MTKLKLVDVNYTYSEGTPFRKDALRNINIEIEDNCITGLIGHTGCGKSTTLYSFLKEVNSPTVNIVTVEDPVEYSMQGINQTQVNAKVKQQEGMMEAIICKITMLPLATGHIQNQRFRR